MDREQQSGMSVCPVLSGVYEGTGRERDHQKANPCGCGGAVHAGLGSWLGIPHMEVWCDPRSNTPENQAEAILLSWPRPKSPTSSSLCLSLSAEADTGLPLGLRGEDTVRTSQRKRSVLHCKRRFWDGIHSDENIFTKYNLPSLQARTL